MPSRRRMPTQSVHRLYGPHLRPASCELVGSVARRSRDVYVCVCVPDIDEMSLRPARGSDSRNTTLCMCFSTRRHHHDPPTAMHHAACAPSGQVAQPSGLAWLGRLPCDRLPIIHSCGLWACSVGWNGTRAEALICPRRCPRTVCARRWSVAVSWAPHWSLRVAPVERDGGWDAFVVR